MQKLKKKKHIKGSTLLLAMVVISTVLFAGIGVATILSRQIKEIPLVENETRGFYIAETIADMMDKNDLEEADCEGINIDDQDIECSAEKVNDKYHVVVKVGGNYYSFIKGIGEGGSGGSNGEESIPEGFIRVYYHMGPWGEWSQWAEPPLINARYYPSGTIIGGGNMEMNNASTKFVNGWFVKDIEVSGEEDVRIFFQDIASGTRDYGSHGSWYHLIPKEKNIAHVRQNIPDKIDLADFNTPITVYYKPDPSWGIPLISSRWDTSPSVTLATKLTPMHDASEKVGEGWYVFHHSGDKRSHILFYFSKDETNENRDYGKYRTYYYCIEVGRTVYIDENTNKDDFMCN